MLNCKVVWDLLDYTLLQDKDAVKVGNNLDSGSRGKFEIKNLIVGVSGVAFFPSALR